jgi:putative transposase
MAKPYSMDLRERAMRRLARGETVRQVAAALSVAPSTVVKWSLRLRRTGAVTPGRTGGRRPRAIRGEHEAWLQARAREADFTLRGLVAELAARGLAVDYRTMWSFIHREGLSFKKNRARQRTGSPRHRAPSEPVEELSGPDRRDAPRLHR